MALLTQPVCNGRAACATSWAIPLDQLKRGCLPTRSHCRRAPLSYSRSRTSKATIYQWRPNKYAVAVEAFLSEMFAESADPDTGSAAMPVAGPLPESV
jgi:hypothetical protein